MNNVHFYLRGSHHAGILGLSHNLKNCLTELGISTKGPVVRKFPGPVVIGDNVFLYQARVTGLMSAGEMSKIFNTFEVPATFDFSVSVTDTDKI